MSAVLQDIHRHDVQGLMQAVVHNPAADGFRPAFSAAQWELFGSFLQPLTLSKGRSLIEQGSQDRRLYWVETGSLTAHREDSKGRVRLAILGPGSVVGEAGFFSHQPRLTSVEAAADGRIWCLTPLRYIELANRQPALAVELCMALGAVMAARYANRPRRVAIA